MYSKAGRIHANYRHAPIKALDVSKVRAYYLACLDRALASGDAREQAEHRALTQVNDAFAAQVKSVNGSYDFERLRLAAKQGV